MLGVGVGGVGVMRNVVIYITEDGFGYVCSTANDNSEIKDMFCYKHIFFPSVLN